VLAYVRSGEVADVTPPGDGETTGDAVAGSGTLGPHGLDGGPGLVSTTRTVPAGNEGSEEAVRRRQSVLCVHNLSRFAQPAELQLGHWAGCTPIEVLGRVPFPVVGEEPYTVTLGPHGFLWFDLSEQLPSPGDLE
jgi:hypothetical protein